MNEAISAVGIISMGRLLFGETAESLMLTLPQLGFPMIPSKSPYWDQSLVQTTKAALKLVPTAKYVFYLDGDSVFKMQELLDMYRIIEKGTVNGKKIDAIVPVQADRTGNKPLVYNWCAPHNQYDYSAPFCPYAHGHFGCTFIRREVFEDGTFPEPWAVGQPAPDGTWDQKPGKMDPDTYFWVKFQQTGHTLVQANDTVIGHLQVGIRWQLADRVIWQHPSDYQVNGKPYGTRVPIPIEYAGEVMPHSTNGTTETTDASAAWHYKSRPIAHLSAQPVPGAIANIPHGTQPTAPVTPPAPTSGYAPPEFAEAKKEAA